MLNLFTIPAASTTIAQVSEYSGPWFQELLPIVYVAIGVSLGVGFVLFLISSIQNIFDKFFHRGGWSAADEEEWYAHHKDPNLPWK